VTCPLFPAPRPSQIFQNHIAEVIQSDPAAGASFLHSVLNQSSLTFSEVITALQEVVAIIPDLLTNYECTIFYRFKQWLITMTDFSARAIMSVSVPPVLLTHLRRFVFWNYWPMWLLLFLRTLQLMPRQNHSWDDWQMYPDIPNPY